MLSLQDVVTVKMIGLVKIPSLKKWRNNWKSSISKKRALFLFAVKLRGSMALEGSMVLPIFLFFMMTILLSLEIVRLQSNVQEALYQSGNEIAFLGYQRKYEGAKEEDPEKRIKEYMEEQIYPYLCVAGGKEGLEIENYTTIENNGIVHLEVSYQIKPFIAWLPVGELCFKDKYYGHAWTGFSGKEQLSDDITKQIYVYVTKTGNRYHLSGECTYLRIPVQSVDCSMLSSIRNKSGGKYYACERCHPGNNGMVFISPEGNRYHGNADCSALKRTVYVIPLDKAAGYSPCSKCAG